MFMKTRRRKRQTPRLFKQKRFFLAIGIGLLVGLGIYGLHRIQVRRQSNTLLERARLFAEDKKYTESLELYKQYALFRPQDSTATIERIAALEEAIKTTPQLTRQIIPLYESLLTFDPDQHEQRLKLAGWYTRFQDYTSARKHLIFLAESNLPVISDDPEVFVLLARGYWSEQNFTSAREYFQKAIEKPKASETTFFEYAVMIRESRAERAALDADKILQNLITVRPQSIEARLARSNYRERYNDRRGAREDIAFAYQNLPGANEHVNLVLQYVQYLVQDSDWKAARVALDRARQTHPNELSLVLALAEVMARTGDFAGAQEQLRAAATKLPDGDPQLLNIGDRLIDVHDRASARSIAQRLNGEGFLNTASGYLAGRSAAIEGDWPSAVPNLQVASQQFEQNQTVLAVKAYLALARCYELANNLDLQDEAFANVLRLDPNLFGARMGRAGTLARLGKLADAAEIYQALALTSPEARLQLIRIRFSQVLAEPESKRDWAPFDQAFGAGTVPVEAVVLKASSLHFRGKADEATAALSTLVKEPRAPASAWSTLALLQGLKGGDECFLTLDQADKTIGISPELRLARAQLLARKPTEAAIGAIVALGTAIEKLPIADQFKLKLGLGQLLVALQKPAEARSLLEAAAKLSPFDLLSRSLLLDVAMLLKEPKLAESTLQEIRKIDGELGPTFIVNDVAYALRTTPKPTTDELAAWNMKLNLARNKRPNWGRLSAMLGDVAVLADRKEEAIAQYRFAIEQGERSDLLIKRTVKLLMERQAEGEAMQVLARAANAGGLSDDLQKQWNLFQSANLAKKDLSLEWAQGNEMAKSKNYLDHLLRARVFVTNNMLKEAQSALGQAREANPNSPEVYALIVRFLVLTKQDAAAKEWATTTRALFANPKTPQPADPTQLPLALAVIAELTQDYPEAEKQYQKLRELRPTELAWLEKLYHFYQVSKHPAKAEQLLNEIVQSDQGHFVRWSRRIQAVNMAGSTENYKDLPKALELLDRNLADGNNDAVDVRTRAFLQGADPSQRKNAIRTLLSSASRAPFTPEDLFHLARMQQHSGEVKDAIQSLQESTRKIALAQPEALALLAKLLIENDDAAAAKSVIARLKLLAPNSWLAASEEARYLVATRDSAGAYRVIAACPACQTPQGKLEFAAPHLEKLGLLPEAESMFKAWLAFAESENKPDAHIPLFLFYTRQHEGIKAIILARKYEKKLSPGTTARLYSAAVYCKPLALVPAAEQATWREVIFAVEKWVSVRLEQSPNNEELLCASAELADYAGRTNDAITLYEKALPLLSQSLRPSIQNNLAYLLAMHQPQNADRALEQINEAIGRRGLLPGLLDTRALVHNALRHNEEALQDVNAAIWGEPKPDYYFHLAMICDRLDRADAKKSALEQAKKAGLTKQNLHPLEWPIYDRFLPK